jgi:hypothetical protein
MLGLGVSPPQQYPVNLALLVAPVPLRATVCGLPEALSVIDSVPLMTPVALGVKVTLIVQLAVDATLVPQLSLSPKLAVAVIPVMFKAALP